MTVARPAPVRGVLERLGEFFEVRAFLVRRFGYVSAPFDSAAHAALNDAIDALADRQWKGRPVTDRVDLESIAPSAPLGDIPPEEAEALFPRALPPNWRRRYDVRFGAGTGIFESVSLAVFFTVGVEEDGQRWAHLSVSRRDGMIPSWLDLVEVRDVLLGRGRLALQVMPPRSDHYSLAGVEVLHLWAPLARSPLPNFLRARGGVL